MSQSKRAVLVVDLQNEYFVGGKLPLPGIDHAAATAAAVIARARQQGDRVIHIRHEFPDAQAPLFTPGSTGVAIHATVQPAANETVILKNFPNSFLKTGLHDTLQAAGVQEVVVIGAMSHMCIEATSRAAADLGYGVTVLQDACATMDLEFQGVTVPAAQVHATAMAALAFAYAKVENAAAY